jgi:uncharacterized membrane protein
MRTKSFLSQLDNDRIVAAIAAAERATSGEIRVCVSRRAPRDALAAARRLFHRLGMARTPHRNAVLLFLAPRAQKFALWGDVAVHEKCGGDFWPALAAQLSPLLKNQQYTDSVLHAVATVGEVLARHFPRQAGDTNALPDAVVED